MFGYIADEEGGPPTAPPGDSPQGPLARPDEWRDAPTGPGTVHLAYTVTTGDIVAAALADPAARKRFEEQVRAAGWRHGLPAMLITLGLFLLANLYLFGLDLAWSVGSTVVLAGMFAVVRWSQVDHTVRRRLPAVLERAALMELAQRGDQRRLVAEPAGVTLVDAAATRSFGWHQVHLVESDRHITLAFDKGGWSLPRSLGQPLAAFVEVARGYGAR